VLQEDDLELDRVLDGVAVVLDHSCLATPLRELVHEFAVGRRLADRRRERPGGQAEPVGLAVVRGPEHDEGPVAKLRAEACVGRRVARSSASDAHVRRGDPDETAGRPGHHRSGGHVRTEHGPQLGRVACVAGAGLCRRANRGAAERRVLRLAQVVEARVVEKPGLAEPRVRSSTRAPT